MSQTRVDSLSKYYKQAQSSNLAGLIFFWISVASSFVVLFLQDGTVRDTTNILFVVATFLYAFFSNLTSLYFLRKAETKRATHLISNSLNVSLDEEETNLYYNNRQVPSIVRLGLNVFENSLHSKGTASIMVKRNLSVILVYLVIWLFMLLNRESSLDLLALLSQTLLTTTIITNFIKLVVLMFGFERSFQDCRNLFLTGIQETPEFYARILQIFTYYESLKASMGITLSSRIFDKYVNPTSTIKWEQIKHNLQIE